MDNRTCILAGEPAILEEVLERQSAYRSVNGAVLFLWKCTRPDITFAVHRLCQCLKKPTPALLKAAEHVLAYLSRTAELGLTYDSSDLAPLTRDWGTWPFGLRASPKCKKMRLGSSGGNSCTTEISRT